MTAIQIDALVLRLHEATGWSPQCCKTYFAIVVTQTLRHWWRNSSSASDRSILPKQHFSAHQYLIFVILKAKKPQVKSYQQSVTIVPVSGEALNIVTDGIITPEHS